MCWPTLTDKKIETTMLTTSEKEQIEKEIRQVPVKKAACIEALKIVQEHRRWVSDEGIRDVADILEMSPEEVDSVATFYNLIFRQPVGRHIILLCDSISCYVMGYQKLYEALQQQLNIKFGETTADKKFTLLPNPCLDYVDRAQAVMIGEDVYKEIEEEEVEEILKKYD